MASFKQNLSITALAMTLPAAGILTGIVAPYALNNGVKSNNLFCTFTGTETRGLPHVVAQRVIEREYSAEIRKVSSFGASFSGEITEGPLGIIKTEATERDLSKDKRFFATFPFGNKLNPFGEKIRRQVAAELFKHDITDCLQGRLDALLRGTAKALRPFEQSTATYAFKPRTADL